MSLTQVGGAAAALVGTGDERDADEGDGDGECQYADTKEDMGNREDRTLCLWITPSGAVGIASSLGRSEIWSASPNAAIFSGAPTALDRTNRVCAESSEGGFTLGAPLPSPRRRAATNASDVASKTAFT